MKFTIIWTKMALEDLANIWMSTADEFERRQITSTADKIDGFVTALMQPTANQTTVKTYHLQINILNVVFTFSPQDRMKKSSILQNK
jgi:hypothetical protein